MRPFTVREYARIQAFPDDWQFSGSMSAQYKQIGNAVPVNLAQAIASSVARFLDGLPEEFFVGFSGQAQEKGQVQLELPLKMVA